MAFARLNCFDIFDTVLTRRVGDPNSVFLMLGHVLSKKGLITVEVETFIRLRRQAESEARRRINPQGDITIEEIWHQLCADLKLPEDLAPAYVQEELKLEESLLRPVPGAAEMIAEARIEGKVVFVSDMYLPRSFLERVLKSYGLWPDDAVVYVSSEHRVLKARGALFRKVLDSENMRAGSVTHIGDNPRSDIDGARAARITARLFNACRLNRYEEIMQSLSDETNGVTAVLAGASRLTRMEGLNKDLRSQMIREVAAGVVAPVLTSFVMWVLKRAKETNVRRLYFVSRDGQILLDVARALTAGKDTDIELRYLYGSRISWNLPSLSSIGEREIGWILDPAPFISVETILSRVDLKPYEIGEILTRFGFAESQWQRHLENEERNRLRSVLLDPTVGSAIIAAAAHRRETAIPYLRQEGFFDGVNSALVDVGWTGRFVDALVLMLQTEDCKVLPRAFYFGLTPEVLPGKPLVPLSEREGFYIDSLAGVTEPVHLPKRVTLLEMFCVADHGLVIGYRDVNGRLEPILKQEDNQPMADWGISEMRGAVVRFVHHFRGGDDYEFAAPLGGLRQAVGQLLNEFWSNPSYEESLIWGSLPWAEDMEDSTWKPLAQPYDFRSVLDCVRGYGYRRHWASWETGCDVLTRRHVRIALKLATALSPHYRRVRGLMSRRATANLQ